MYLTRYLYTQFIDQKNVLLYNTLSGAMDIIERSIFDIIIEGKWENIPYSIFSTLVKRKYLFENIESERVYFNNLISRLYHVNRKRTKSPYFYLCITYNCNLKCTYCNEFGLVFPGNRLQMSFSQIDQVFQSILSITSLENLQRRNIILYGGEPLMESTYEIVKYIIEKVKSIGIKVDVITNGVEVELFVDIFTKNASSFGTFIITLDGPEEIHNRRRPKANGDGSFNEVVQNIELLSSLGFQVEVQAILDNQNIQYLSDLYNIIIEKEWNTLPNLRFFIGKTTFIKEESLYPWNLSEDLFISLILDQIKNKPDINRVFKKFTGGMRISSYLYSSLERKANLIPNLLGCRACNPGVYVMCPDGLVYPCLELLGMSRYAIGKFHPQILWFTDRIKQWRKYNVTQIPRCRTCKYLFLCRGGCIAYRLIKYGSFKKTECPNIEKIIHTCFHEWLSTRNMS